MKKELREKILAMHRHDPRGFVKVPTGLVAFGREQFQLYSVEKFLWWQIVRPTGLKMFGPIEKPECKNCEDDATGPDGYCDCCSGRCAEEIS